MWVSVTHPNAIMQSYSKLLVLSHLKFVAYNKLMQETLKQVDAKRPLANSKMWSNLPYDLLSHIFSYLSPDSLARARSACRQWSTCPIVPPACHHQAWFLALPTRRHGLPCYAYNPERDNWHSLSLDFVPDQVKPVASVGGLILLKLTSSTALQLAICNLFTRQFKTLPALNTKRTNPAVGLIEFWSSKQIQAPHFRVYVAGGMSEVPGGGASYEPRLEMYDSRHDKWQISGTMPAELAVRLTVWTPNDSVYCNGVLYWITSARAYSVMGFDVGIKTWKQLSVPLADHLEFAALVRTNERLTLVGGICGGDASVWELGDGGAWILSGKVPCDLAMRFLGGKGSWVNTKCVGIDGELWLYRDLSSGMVVWRENLEKGKWEWIWFKGCKIRGKQVPNLPIKGMLLHPNLASSCIII